MGKKRYDQDGGYASASEFWGIAFQNKHHRVMEPGGPRIGIYTQPQQHPSSQPPLPFEPSGKQQNFIDVPRFEGRFTRDAGKPNSTCVMNVLKTRVNGGTWESRLRT